MSIFAKYIRQAFYFLPQTSLRTDVCSSRKKSFEHAGNCVKGYMNVAWSVHLLELVWDEHQIHISYCHFFTLMSRKFKHFSSLSSSVVNWMCLSCLFKRFWNSRDCSLDENRAWVSSAHRLYVSGARFKVSTSANV